MICRGGRSRQHVARNLLHGEAVERQVAVEGVDDPIAPAPHRALGVGLVSVGVGVARGVEPAHRHALAVIGRGQQPVDYFLVGIRRCIVDESLDIRQRRRQTRQVERHAPDQRAAVGLGRGLEAFSIEARQYQLIDWISRPGGIAHIRKRGSRGRNKSPVLLPARPLCHPAFQQVDLAIAQLRKPRPGRRHAARLVFARDTADDLAGLRIARDDIRLRGGLHIQPQLAFARRPVRAVAGVAALGEDRSDVAVEQHIRGPSSRNDTEDNGNPNRQSVHRQQSLSRLYTPGRARFARCTAPPRESCAPLFEANQLNR